jgi:hypothetical protein
LDHVFVRGYVYVKSPEPGGTKEPIQRKLVYYMDNPSSLLWSAVLDTFSASGRMQVAVTNAYVGRTQIVYWELAYLDYDQWYCLELEIKANTPGASDGVFRLWINGTQVWEKTNADMRGTYTTGIGHIRVGEQADRTNYTPVDEYRYWDDVVISTSLIGP